MKRIVVTGAESSGKSTLAQFLANRFRIPTAPEYARIYLETHGAAYDYAVVHQIAREHLVYQSERVSKASAWGIYDTDLLNFIIWCEVAYGNCESWLREAAARETHHVYLICKPDTPWEYDPLRESPHDRELLYEKHLDAVIATGREYQIISGMGSERMEQAEQAVMQWMA